MAPQIRRLLVGVFAPLLCAFSVPAANAEAAPCEMSLVSVDTSDERLHERVCEAVESAVPILERCQLTLKRPILISFSNELESADQVCFGLFHHGESQIELLYPEIFAEAHEQSAVWIAIPVDEHFNSIVIHELTHAYVDQAVTEGPTDSADWEYIAYAMQIESLSASTRDGFIANVGVTDPVAVEELGSMMLGFSPARFAAKSWLHFVAPENGCDFVGNILRGEQTLMMLPE